MYLNFSANQLKESRVDFMLPLRGVQKPTRPRCDNAKSGPQCVSLLHAVIIILVSDREIPLQNRQVTCGSTVSKLALISSKQHYFGVTTSAISARTIQVNTELLDLDYTFLRSQELKYS